MSTAPTDEEDPEELRRFREQWRSEVLQKKHQQRAQPVSSASRPDDSAHPTSASPGTRPDAEQIHDAPPPKSTATPSASFVTNGFIVARSTALDVYRQAVRCEQSSQLDDALRLYRQAFKLDPDVDRAYMRAEQNASSTQTSAHTGKHKHEKSASVEGVEVLKLPTAVGARHIDRTAVTGVLAMLLRAFPNVLRFDPEDEQFGVPLNSLPDELLIVILRYLDTMGIERFATACRKARVISLDSAIWRPLVEGMYKFPQIAEDGTVEEIIGQYAGDHRRVYIEHPRVRLDGVYIAICQYIRPGLSENLWVNVSHLITYHRYLRFYPNGQVISLLANEEHAPHDIIHSLKPTLRMKGLYFGTWRLIGTTVRITDLFDPSKPGARYTFQMTLNLRSRPTGRWNKLDFDGYDSVDVESGEATPLGLKNERPFWFSKVRSYA